MTQQGSSDNTLRLLLDKLIKEDIKNLSINSETLGQENANGTDEIKELAYNIKYTNLFRVPND